MFNVVTEHLACVAPGLGGGTTFSHLPFSAVSLHTSIAGSYFVERHNQTLLPFLLVS